MLYLSVQTRMVGFWCCCAASALYCHSHIISRAALVRSGGADRCKSKGRVREALYSGVGTAYHQTEVSLFPILRQAFFKKYIYFFLLTCAEEELNG